MDKIRVMVNGVEKVCERGTTFLELSKTVADQYESDIILATKNGQLLELNREVTEDCEVSFLPVSDNNGHKTYIRGITMVMLKAIYNVMGRDNVKKVSVEHSIGNGFYGEIEADVPVNEEIIADIEAEMRNIVERDIPFEKYTIHTNEAIERFASYRMYDKEKLFRFRRVSKTNVYRLGGFEDYFYGYMPPSTKMLKYFKLYFYEGGFILQLPSKKEPSVVPEFKPSPKLFAILKQTNDWCKAMEVETVGALNERIASGGMGDLILVQEALQEKRIAEIAEKIANAGNKKFVMIAGPSSSGKTTFSHRLSIQLRTFGLKPHPIPVDDYFLNRADTPLNPDGSYNYECLEAIDVEQFNKDMTALLEGKTVELPTYNFKTGKREYNGNYKTLGPDDILVIEGIHGLNDALSYALPVESKFKIYISALTTLNIDEHNRISTSDGRLIRRMVRDARTRGTTAKKTIEMWGSVRHGEENYIFPFQESADVMFNSALIYELAILKQYAEPVLFGIDRDDPVYPEVKRLLKFLDYFVGVSSEDVPGNSILREFIGNSCFYK